MDLVRASVAWLILLVASWSASAQAQRCNDPEVEPGDVATPAVHLNESTGEVVVVGDVSGVPGCDRVRVVINSTTAPSEDEDGALPVSGGHYEAHFGSVPGAACGRQARVSIECRYKQLHCSEPFPATYSCTPPCPTAAVLSISNSSGGAVSPDACVPEGTYTVSLTAPVLEAPSSQIYWSLDGSPLPASTDDASIEISLEPGESRDFAVAVLPGAGCPPAMDSNHLDACLPVECGNGTTEPGETCDGVDCPTACANTAAKCFSHIGSSEHCNASCQEEPCSRKSCDGVHACASGDGCCPRDCSHDEDSDCLGTDACAGVTQCIDSDQCCPGSCTEARDNDCSCGWEFWECIEFNLCWLLALVASILASLGLVLLAMMPTSDEASRWETINAIGRAIALGSVTAGAIIEALVFGFIIAILFAICPCEVAIGVAVGCLVGIIVIAIILYYSGSSAVPNWLYAMILGVVGIVGMLAYYGFQCA